MKWYESITISESISYLCGHVHHLTVQIFSDKGLCSKPPVPHQTVHRPRCPAPAKLLEGLRSDDLAPERRGLGWDLWIDLRRQTLWSRVKALVPWWSRGSLAETSLIQYNYVKLVLFAFGAWSLAERERESQFVPVSFLKSRAAGTLSS